MNLDKFRISEIKITDKIVFFHGINRESYFKKGNDFFEKALEIIKDKYENKIEILTAENVAYEQYINMYDKANIVLDQLYGHDQGSNGLEAMAKGKAVFTNASDVFEKHYNLTEKVAINGLPDINYLVNELSFLIDNPTEITALGKRARIFIEREHDNLTIASNYLALWQKANA
jgi:glycosyltransferase involved in cell wall biosynthesis